MLLYILVTLLLIYVLTSVLLLLCTSYSSPKSAAPGLVHSYVWLARASCAILAWGRIISDFLLLLATIVVLVEQFMSVQLLEAKECSVRVFLLQLPSNEIAHGVMFFRVQGESIGKCSGSGFMQELHEVEQRGADG